MKNKTCKITIAILFVMSSNIFAQNDSIFTKKSLAFSYSQRETYGYKDFFEKRVNAHYYFINSAFTQTGIIAGGNWFSNKADSIPIITKLLTFGITNNLQILPIFNISKSRVDLFLPITIGSEYNNSFNSLRLIYEYGIGGKLYATKRIGLFTQFTNTSYKFWSPYYTFGVSFKL